MNRNEQKILALIERDPYLSQQEMADALGISRPSLANLISGLIKQGRILGRAYVLPEEMRFCASAERMWTENST